MKKSRWTLTLAVAAVVAGLGIAAAAYFTSTAVEAQSDGLPGTIAWLPASATVVGHVDVSALLSSPLRDQWEDELQERDGRPGVDEFREMTGLDPFTDIYAASFAVVPQDAVSESSDAPKPPERWGIAIHGAFDSERLLAKIRESASVSDEDYAGTRIYGLAKREGDDQDEDEDRSNSAIAFADADTLLVGDPDYLREMLDTGAGRSASATVALAEHWGDWNFSQDAFWVAASPKDGFGGMMPQGAAEIPPIQSLALSGRLDADLALRARGIAADGEAATKLADVVRGFVALGSLQRGSNADLGVILDSIQIEQIDNEVEISLLIPYEALERLSQQRNNTAAELENP